MAKEIKLPFSELKGTLNDAPIEPTIEITENGVHNVKGYVYADVNVEGGGGESDFSTAIVTTTGGNEVNYSPMPILIYNDELMVRPLQPTSNMVLYKGTQKFVFTKNVHPITSAEGTGGVSVEYDAEYQEYLVTVTGDGTLTITTEAA